MDELPTNDNIIIEGTSPQTDDANANKNNATANNASFNLINSNPSLHPEWSHEHEDILIEWADKAMCYRWLHAKSNAMYYRLNALYTIPVIVISTLTGTANFAVQRIPEEYQGLFLMAAGGFNILAGIISTIQQFLKITQLNEAHRVSSITWDKFYRNIKIELAKHPDERMNVVQMIKISKEEFDRLMETSPIIPDNIINVFKNTFQKTESYEEIIKPEIVDVLVSTNNYRNPWLADENKDKRMQEKIKMSLLKDQKEKKMNDTNVNVVKNFKDQFNSLNNREPIDAEIIDNLKDKMELTILKNIIDQLKMNTILFSSITKNNDDNV